MSSGVETAPLVSAIVILYNQGRFARAAIESVLVQD
jgi:glycosyltransferase involved in cell wall biosynthesis